MPRQNHIGASSSTAKTLIPSRHTASKYRHEEAHCFYHTNRPRAGNEYVPAEVTRMRGEGAGKILSPGLHSANPIPVYPLPPQAYTPPQSLPCVICYLLVLQGDRCCSVQCRGKQTQSRMKHKQVAPEYSLVNRDEYLFEGLTHSQSLFRSPTCIDIIGSGIWLHLPVLYTSSLHLL